MEVVVPARRGCSADKAVTRAFLPVLVCAKATQARMPVLLCLFLAAMPTPAAGLAVVNAASYTVALAPESVATAFGTGLAVTGGGATSVMVQDSTGTARSATLLNAFPLQVAFVIPAGTAPGSATVTVTPDDGAVSTAAVPISTVAPGLFAANANGQGVAAAVAIQGANASLIFACGTAPLSCSSVPVNAIRPCSNCTAPASAATALPG
jgi:hypothetical protein